MKLLIKGLDLTETITEEWITQNCYIAGGACVSSATRSQIHDVDIYFKTKEARDYFIEEIGCDKYISADSNYWKALSDYNYKINNKEIDIGDDVDYIFSPIKVTSDVYNDIVVYQLYYKNVYIAGIPLQLFNKQQWMFENGYNHVLLERNHFEVGLNKFLGNKSITIMKNDLIYQFILRFYGDPQEMMDETFDFQHCKIAYDLSSRDYIATKETYECLSKRELHYVNSYYPVSSLKRLYKYGGRGYKWNNDEFVKIIRDIHNIDISNKFLLEDQLIGYYEDFDYNDTFI